LSDGLGFQFNGPAGSFKGFLVQFRHVRIEGNGLQIGAADSGKFSVP